jgi:flagellar motor switch/type III secretory pathway protein FliN
LRGRSGPSQEPGLKPAAGAKRDHGATKPGALERSVDRPQQLAERSLGGVRIVGGESVTEAIKRRREELRQVRVQGEIQLGQLNQPIEELVELTIRDIAKLPRRLLDAWVRKARERLSSDGPPWTPQQRFALRPEPQRQGALRPTFATDRILAWPPVGSRAVTRRTYGQLY